MVVCKDTEIIMNSKYIFKSNKKSEQKKLLSSKSKEEKQFFNLYGYFPKQESTAKRAAVDIASHKKGEKWVNKYISSKELKINTNLW